MKLSRRQAMLLAALLSADGAVVAYPLLGDVVGTSGVNDNNAVRQYVQRMRRDGLDCVEIVPGRGCRLVALPPDELLDVVLGMLDEMRRGETLAPIVLRRTA